MTFKEYLQSENLMPSTVREHIANLKRFEEWCKLEKHPNHDVLNYRELMGYVQYLKGLNLTASTVNIRLSSISKYYAFLMYEGVRENNPASQLRVKKDPRKIHPDLFKAEELDMLYINYKNRETFKEPKHRLIHERHTVLLSLIIYQGLNATDLKQIEIHHIDFDKGTIYIPDASRSNERTLKLHPAQILLLYQYTTQTLQELKQKGSSLFPNIIGNTLTSMMVYLKKINPSIRKVEQLRASVIVDWIRKHNIRQAQYMAGHKHISSTERYKQQDIESLQEAILKYHPLG